MKITISQEGSSPISIEVPERSNESVSVAAFVIATWIAAMGGVSAAAIVAYLKSRKYSKISEFINDPEIKKFLEENKTKFAKKGLTPIPVSELTNLTDAELKEQTNLISRNIANNARNKIIGYHLKDMIPGFGTILYSYHYTNAGLDDSEIQNILYGIFRNSKGKIVIKRILFFRMPYSTDAFDVSFKNDLTK